MQSRPSRSTPSGRVAARSLVLVFLLVGVVALWSLWSDDSAPPGTFGCAPVAARSTERAEPPGSALESVDPSTASARLERTAVDAVAKTPSIDSTTAEPPGDRSLEERLDAAARTFLTEHPDVEVVRALAIELARLAVVDEASVRTDADGIRRGRFTIPGTALKGEFELHDDEYDVSVRLATPTDGATRFFAGELSLRSIEERGRTAAGNVGVQFHPDTSRPAPEFDGGEQIVGWTSAMNATGSSLHPITAGRAPDGTSWRIGHAQSMRPIERPGDSDWRANDAWLSRLRAYRPTETR